jgi:hypothetical protein
VVLIVAEPDARAVPGTNANTPTTPTHKTTARARPRASNKPNLRVPLKDIPSPLLESVAPGRINN